MRKFRAAIVPVLALIALGALAWPKVDLPVIAHFDFIWDVIVGAGLGVILALLPTLSGFSVKRNAFTSMYWVCGFAALLVVFYQYMVLVSGLRIDVLSFLASAGTRMRMVEGALLGYCTTIAGRGKV